MSKQSNKDYINNLFGKKKKYNPYDIRTEQTINEIEKYEYGDCHSEFSIMFYKLIKQFNFKVAFLLFIFYILLNTDIFNKYILSKYQKNIYENNSLTEKGLIVIGTLLSCIYMIIDVLNNNDYI